MTLDFAKSIRHRDLTKIRDESDYSAFGSNMIEYRSVMPSVVKEVTDQVQQHRDSPCCWTLDIYFIKILPTCCLPVWLTFDRRLA